MSGFLTVCWYAAAIFWAVMKELMKILIWEILIVSVLWKGLVKFLIYKQGLLRMWKGIKFVARKVWHMPMHAVPDILLWMFILGGIATGLIWYHYIKK